MNRKENLRKFKIFYSISLAWQLGFLIVIPLVIFILIGVWLDKKFGSSPWFLLISIIIASLATYYDTVYLLKPLIKKEKDEDKK